MKKAILRVVVVPGGSSWRCAACQGKLLSGYSVVKAGRGIYYCQSCVSAGRPSKRRKLA